MNLEINIREMVHKKVMHFVNKSQYEVSGLGKVLVRHDPEAETTIIEVVDAILLPQKNTSTTTEIDGAAIGKAMYLMKDSPGYLLWWWHCVTGDTSVLLATGELVPAKDLFERRDVKLVAYDQANDRFCPAEISQRACFEAPIVRIRTTLNREIKVTENHRMLTPSGWKMTRDLKIGEKLAIPGKQVHLNEETALPRYADYGHFRYSDASTVSFNDAHVRIPTHITPEFGALLGWMVSEGSIDKGTRNLHFTQKDVSVLHTINKMFQNVFGVSCEFYRPPSAPERERCGEIRLVSHRAVANYLMQLGIAEGRGVKRVPACIMKAPVEVKEAFLQAMIDGDGSYDQRGRILYKRIYTVHKELANDLMYLVSSLGYRAGQRQMHQNFANHSPQYPVVYDVYWNSTDLVETTLDWVEIKELEPVGIQTVYSYTIPVHENYVCGHGPFVSHNSHVRMPVKWSGTDEEIIFKMAKQGWICCTVFNQQGEYTSAYAQNGPVPFWLPNVDTWLLERPIPKRLVTQWDQDYETMVENQVPKPANQVSSVGVRDWSAHLEAEFGDRWWSGDEDTTKSLKDRLASGETDMHDELVRAGMEIENDPRDEAEQKVMATLYDACVESGLNEKEAEEILELAARAMENGTISLHGIEQTLVNRVLEKAQAKEGRTS